MTNNDKIKLWLLCIASVLFTGVLIVRLIGRILTRRQRVDGERQHKGLTFLSACCFLLFSVWALRYAVNYYLLCTGEASDRVLTGFEQFFNSFVHALQTFSMDEDYTEYIRSGKQMMAALTQEGSFWEHFYGVYASALNMAAPIAGGAIVFEILTSFFPNVRLWFNALLPWRQLYFFSDLSERSLALARSILTNRPAHTVIVFTGTNTDTDDNEEEKLMESARLIGAVCVKTDLRNLRCRIFGKRTFFLMHEDETQNLNALIAIAKKDKRRIMHNAEVYLFADLELYKRASEMIKDSFAQNGYTKDRKIIRNNTNLTIPGNMPLILPISVYQNLIQNLLTRVPLFEALIPGRDLKANEELRVTILGTGLIGTEMLLDAYWCGQLLGVRLMLDVISEEDESAFYERLNSINPEILRTSDPDDDILLMNGRGDRSEPYCTFRYHQANLTTASLSALLAQEDPKTGRSLLDTHYFAVALGDDTLNIHIADKIQIDVSRRHLQLQQAAGGKPITLPRTVITCAVYDPELCEAMNNKSAASCDSSDCYDTYLYAFGSLKEEFSMQTIMMRDTVLYAQKMGQNYKERTLKEEIKAKKIKERTRYYDLWANIARLSHTPYRMFSFGLRMPSVFDNEPQVRWEDVIAAYYALSDHTPEETITYGDVGKYRDMFLPGAFPEDLDALKALLHRGAWLEHRRWNAFTRTRGFEWTDAEDFYYKTVGDHKNLNLKLHPCLVECDQNGMHPDLKTEYEAVQNDPAKRDAIDRLDLLTYHCRYVLECKDYDFKLYDYPYYYLDPSLEYLRTFLK
ncbi:MAG: hypothetical protein IKS42_11180 [Oscillospiraceae bacterium]|nr:hypothetical protein [Oscillospiraceae bacterium]